MVCDTALDQVLAADASSQTRLSAVTALGLQLEEMGAAEQQVLRMLLLRAARIAESRSSSGVADDLDRLALKDALWLVTRGALEACDPPVVPLRVIVQDGPPINSFIEQQLQLLSPVAGPDLETKYRFTALKHDAGVLSVALAPTSWTSASMFHDALQRDPAWASKQSDGRWLRPVPFGDQMLPGMAVVHAIIATSDGKVIAAQRSDEVNYSPGHWSVSFEEQLNEKDFGRNEDPFVAATQRGFHEEFGAEIAPGEVVPLAVLLQIDVLNLGVVMLVRTAMTATEIRDSWRSSAKDSWEAQQVYGLPLGELDTSIARFGQQIHPTSELRCLALRRWLKAQ
jgi:hypothetical protein